MCSMGPESFFRHRNQSWPTRVALVTSSFPPIFQGESFAHRVALQRLALVFVRSRDGRPEESPDAYLLLAPAMGFRLSAAAAFDDAVRPRPSRDFLGRAH